MSERFLSSEEYDEQAHQLYNDGDYEGALEMLKEGLFVIPQCRRVMCGAGLRSSGQGGICVGEAGIRACSRPRQWARGRLGGPR